MSGTTRYCCEAMQDDLERGCPTHRDRSDCPDALIARGRHGGYGLWIHDGGSSLLPIAFCPWCGTRLPKGRWRPAIRRGTTARHRSSLRQR